MKTVILLLVCLLVSVTGTSKNTFAKGKSFLNFLNPFSNAKLRQSVMHDERCPVIEWDRLLTEMPKFEEITPSLVISVDEFDLEFTKFPEIWNLMEREQHVVALYYTYRITSSVMTRWIRCPTVLFDRMTIKVLGKTIGRLMDSETKPFRDELIGLVEEVALDNPNWDPIEFSDDFIDHMHDVLYKDTMYLLMKSNMRDLYSFAMFLFNHVNKTLATSRNPSSTTIRAAVGEVFTRYVLTCPSVDTIINNHQEIIGDLVRSFKDKERRALCQDMWTFLSRWWTSSESGRWNFYTICNTLGSFVDVMVEDVKKYEDYVTSEDWENVKEFLSNYLDPKDVELLNGVLEFFYLPPVGPESGKTREFHVYPDDVPF